ncbi:MAG TPA: GAF domain-containing protein [Ktedonobacterales bacterium]|nr:GAF domain-containing protein [Ktedonobacterales bacterium]
MGEAKMRRRATEASDVDGAGGMDGAQGSRDGARGRRGGMRSRGRESAVIGLVERARLTPSLLGMGLLLDPLLSAMPTIRSALLNRSLDDALRIAGGHLAASLAPCVAQVWIADPAVWSGPNEQIGGLELFPTLRLRASLRAEVSSAPPSPAPDTTPADALPPGVSYSREPSPTDPLVEEVATTRRPVVLFSDAERSVAGVWFDRLPEVVSTGDAAQGPGTLLALPLRARGQFLGVMALVTRQRLAQRQLTALDELSDLLALAADRDRLLSYSRTQEALAQTMVRHAPVAMALLTGPDHVVALANPAFFDLLGVEDSQEALGVPLRQSLADGAARFSTMLRLDAVFHGSEPQAMIELPIHLGRGATYWNVTTSPVVGEGGAIGGVLVAAVDVTRQVTARYRAQELAEDTQVRIAQMVSLHATTLDTAKQVGSDPRDLLASILRRSIALLSAQAGVIYARGRRGDELEVVVSQGLRGEYTGSRIRVGEGLAGQVAQTGQGRVIDDYRAYPAHSAIYDGETVTAIISVPLAHHGQVIGVLDVLDDAERRVFTDDDLWLLELFAAQAAQAMENARMYVELESAYRKQRDLDRMKDDFIATASHELRTPLTVVQGYLELLRAHPAAQVNAQVASYINKSATAADDLADVADRLLQTSRLDTGRIELHMTPVRLAQVIDESLRAFRALQEAQGKTHELIMEAPEDAYALADLGRLKETLDNLISNAIKYSPKGGRVRVWWESANFSAYRRKTGAPALAPASGVADGADIGEQPTMRLNPLDAQSGPEPDATEDPCAPSSAVVEAAREQPYHIILVSDAGMGIPEAERPNLFGRFSRLESARASQIRGVGLGLYICRQTLRAMGGDIWLRESTPDEGSIFAFTLPAAGPTSGA